jgi:hypothetical protein
MENFVMISKLLILELVKCFIYSYPETPRVGGQEGCVICAISAKLGFPCQRSPVEYQPNLQTNDYNCN